ncbi:MFS transporter [Streptomyces sp. Isolate_45]|uniref:MFS transporter n=1 Tax=Streptomyces sp. Isolate_45 TaxID=2950111 RepID=UPI002481C9C5|nr:MFS transporter [Streptomyces sp. Isolate_45]MDA5281151.1 MFS transporter [Streptomyces sp. Isolate_45]
MSATHRPSATPATPVATPAARVANTAPATPASTGTGPAGRPVPALLLALMAAPLAAGANAPVLIVPDIAGSLGVPVGAAAQLLTAFGWAVAVATPLLAGLLRHRGTAALLRLSAALVLAGALIVAVSPWLPLTLLGRCAQAAGGAGFVAVAIGLAGTARRMGVVSAGFGVLGAAGPLLGKALAETASWRLALALPVVAMLAVPAVGRRAAATRAASSPAPGRFDARGAVLLTALVTALVLLATAPLAALGAALVAAALLVPHVRRRPEGFVPVALLRKPVFVGSALLALTVSTSYFTVLLTVPRLLADRAGWDPAAVGTGQLLALLAGSALSWPLAAVSSRMSRAAVRTVLASTGAASALTAVLADSGPLLLAATAAGVFTATAANAVLSTHAVAAAPDAGRRPAAIGLFTLAYQLGGAFGPAAAGLLVLGA